MNSRTISILAVSALLLMAVAAAVPSSDADSTSFYEGQLDVNGSKLMEKLEGMFSEAEKNPSDSISVSYAFEKPILLDEGTAESYAKGLVKDVLAAYYLSDPSPIWLWDLPVSPVSDVDTTSAKTTVTLDGRTVTYDILISVSFELSVPDSFRNDPSTETNEILTAIEAVKAELSAYEGSVEDKASSINDRLRGIASKTDEEGTVSTIYDALVEGESSSAGVAAAFTALCRASGMDVVTVAGSVMTGSDGSMEAGYWNAVLDGESWYAVDCTWNSSTSKNCLMAGVTTEMSFAQSTERFGSTHSANASQLGSSLESPQISNSGVEWPDERGFFEKYGMYLFAALVAAIVVITLLHAVRVGDV